MPDPPGPLSVAPYDAGSATPVTLTGPAGAGEARRVIVEADELGLCHAANEGVHDVMRRGLATSAALLVAAPWAREAAARHRGEDVGVLLSANAEHDRYRWGPVTWAPSLLDGDGGFPRTAADVWEHADPDEVRREMRAQLERAVLWGFELTHVAVQHDTLLVRPELADVVVDVAAELALPLRSPAREVTAQMGFDLGALAADRGVQVTGDVIDLGRAIAGADLDALIGALSADVTVLVGRPAVDAPELRSLTPGWRDRVAQHELLLVGSALDDALERHGVARTDYRSLRAEAAVTLS